MNEKAGIYIPIDLLKKFRKASKTGSVDVVLPLEKIAGELIRILRPE